MTIVEYFDPYNQKHLEAYLSLQTKGNWPVEFYKGLIGIVFESDWHVQLMAKMANEWILHRLWSLRESEDSDRNIKDR